MNDTDLALEFRYRVEGRLVLLPYSLAKKATTYPKYCVVHAAADDAEHVPARKDSNLCDPCIESMRADLLLIEERWPHLSDALAATRQARRGGERAGSSDTGRALPIDPEVSEVIRSTQREVHLIIVQLVKDRPSLKLPLDHGTDDLAGWLARWHIEYVATHPSADHSMTSYHGIQRAADEVRKYIGPQPARQPIQSNCHQFIDDGSGSRLPCPGQLEGVMYPGGSKVVECSEDPLHYVPIEEWLMIHARRTKLARKHGTRATRPARRSSGQGA